MVPSADHHALDHRLAAVADPLFHWGMAFLYIDTTVAEYAKEEASAHPWIRLGERVGLFEVEAPLHALDASFGVNDALLSGEIWMALAAYLHPEGRLCRPHGKGVAAGAARHLGIRVVGWVYIGFHGRSYTVTSTG